jgi:lipopolysaccharide/colanic/teichoic acid biosynthesis glycosyltransferase
VIRLLDILLTLALLVFFLPLIAITGILVWIVDPGPILFRHRRVGYQGKEFYCLKFRSMVVDAERRLEEVLASDPAIRAAWLRDHKLPTDPRITKIGKFLRASSLDELPQLFNVLRGEMSLVGPRPIVKAEVPRYGRYIADYYSVVPGVTGLWQIGGRSDTSYRRRVALDVAFARSRSPGLYLKILVLTVPAVLLARGSY